MIIAIIRWILIILAVMLVLLLCWKAGWILNGNKNQVSEQEKQEAIQEALEEINSELQEAQSDWQEMKNELKEERDMERRRFAQGSFRNAGVQEIRSRDRGLRTNEVGTI